MDTDDTETVTLTNIDKQIHGKIIEKLISTRLFVWSVSNDKHNRDARSQHCCILACKPVFIKMQYIFFSHLCLHTHMTMTMTLFQLSHLCIHIVLRWV